MTELTGSRFNLFKVVEDSPQRLVLEDKSSRWIGGLLLALPTGGVLLGQLDLNRSFDVFGTPVDARWVVGAFTLFALWLLLERQRIVFDRASGSVRRSNRINRLKNLERPLADIQGVTVKNETTSQYGEESTNYRAHLVFRDGKKVLVNLSGDGAFTTRLRERIESFRP